MAHPYIVTVGTPDRCVIFGWSAKKIAPGDSPMLTKARMVLYWDRECNGLFGLAARGPRGKTRLTDQVTTCPGTVVRLIEVSPTAAKEMDEWPSA